MPDIAPRADMFQDILDHMLKTEKPAVRALPSWPPYDVLLAKATLVQQSHQNLVAAMGNANFVAIVGTTANMIEQLISMMIAMGVDLRPIWAAIQAGKAPEAEAVDIGDLLASQNVRLSDG